MFKNLAIVDELVRVDLVVKGSIRNVLQAKKLRELREYEV